MKNPFLRMLCSLLLVAGLSLRDAEATDTRVILFIVDSVSADLLYEMLAAGDLPNMAAALKERGVRVDEAIAPFPTISFSAHACILTGCFSDRHNVPAIRWYDHRTGHSRSYAGFGSELIDRDMDSAVPTIFESLADLHTAAIGSVVHRGADEYVRPWMPPDGLRMRSLLKRFRRADPPRLSVVVLTGIDWPAHRYGPKSEWVRIDLRKLDRRMGEMFELLRRRGLDRSTYVFFTADHGHAPRAGYVDLYALLTRLGFDPLDKFLYTGRTDGFTSYDAILWMAGVGYSFLYLPHRTDTAIDWRTRPGVEMLRSYPVGGRRVDLIGALTARTEIAFVVVRDPRTGRVQAFDANGAIDPANDLADYPDAAVQLPRLMAGARAPDILVVTRDGYETAWSWHRGRHGGYSREEIVVPLIVWGPGVTPGRIARARTVDCDPAILRLFGRSIPPGMDGVPLDLQIAPHHGRAP